MTCQQIKPPFHRLPETAAQMGRSREQNGMGKNKGERRNKVINVSDDALPAAMTAGSSILDRGRASVRTFRATPY